MSRAESLRGVQQRTETPGCKCLQRIMGTKKKTPSRLTKTVWWSDQPCWFRPSSVAVAMVASASVTIVMLHRTQFNLDKHIGSASAPLHRRPRLHSGNDIIRTSQPQQPAFLSITSIFLPHFPSLRVSPSAASPRRTRVVRDRCHDNPQKSHPEVNPKLLSPEGRTKAPCEFPNKYAS